MRWPRLVVFAVLSAAALSGGCSRWTQRPGSPFTSAAPSVGEVVSAVNRNADRVQALYAKDIGISVSNLPLDGWMAIEKSVHAAHTGQPARTRFRLIAKNPIGGGREADLGANDEEFWFYVRRGPQGPELVHCSYADYNRARLALPFEPAWIVESTGITAMGPAEDYVIQPGRRGTVELSTPTVTPQGQPASKITVVQLSTGWIVARRLESAGRLIASAVLSRHRTDPASGAVYPGTIEIQWPEAGFDVTIRLQEVIVNPTFEPAVAESLWQMPSDVVPSGAHDVNLGATGAPARSRRRPGVDLSPDIRGGESDL
jgi:hypothetical protein